MMSLFYYYLLYLPAGWNSKGYKENIPAALRITKARKFNLLSAAINL
jgi:hypothetical protein